MVEYGVPAGEVSTVVARSQAVRGWGTASPGTRLGHGVTVCHISACTQVGHRLAWLTGSKDYLASPVPLTDTCP